MVVHDDFPAERCLDANHGLDAFRRLRRVAIAPIAIVARRLAGGAGLLAHLVQLFRGAVAIVGVAHLDEFMRDFGMARGTGELGDRLTFPVEAQPLEAIDQRRHRGFGRAFTVGVLDAKQHLAAAAAREEPVEQCGARAADMQIAGRRRGEAGDGHRLWP